VRVSYALGCCETLLEFYEGPDTIGEGAEWRQWGICDWFVRSAGCLLVSVLRVSFAVKCWFIRSLIVKWYTKSKYFCDALYGFEFLGFLPEKATSKLMKKFIFFRSD